MSDAQRDTSAGDRGTKWGGACVELWSAMLSTMPDLKANVGLDEKAKIGSPPLVTFLHGGEDPTWPYRGAGGGGPRHVYDRAIALDVECWGRTAAEAEAIYEALLIATNLAAHGRAAKLGNFKPQDGTKTSGNLGAKWTGKLTVRLAVNEPPIRTAKPTSHGVAVAALGPGEMPPKGEEVGLP